MALVRINQNEFLALSSDISGGTIDGLGVVGARVFITDTSEWYIVESDLQLAAYSLPITLGGSITIGSVDQGNPGVSAWPVDGSGFTQPVSAVSLPLPTGASTSSKQDTTNTSLSGIDTKIGTTNSSLTTIDGHITDGNTSLSSIDTKATTTNNTLSSVDGKITTTNSNLSTIDGHIVSGNSSLSNIDSKTSTTNTTLSSVDSRLSSIDTKASTTNTTLGTIDTRITSSNTLLSSIDTKVGNVSLKGVVDSLNSTSTPLNNGQTFTGTWSECVNYPSISFITITDFSGSLYIDFSTNGSNIDRTITYTVAGGTTEIHRVTVIARYYRLRFTNDSGSNETYLRLQSILGSANPLTTQMIGGITSDQDTLITRSVISGSTDGGSYVNVPVTQEGHLEVAIHAPRLPFGSIHTEKLTPVFQTDAVYSFNSGQVYGTSILGGSTSVLDSSFVASSGTTVGAYAVIESRRRLRYRPGQGIVGRFTAIYSSPVANSYQIAGYGHSEDGVYFGYGNTSDLSDTRFGILYVKRGVRATYTLTLTTRATSAGNVTITLNGTATVVALTNTTLQQNVYEISQATYAGWDAFPSGATVVFVRKSAGTTPNSFSFSAGATGSAASISQTKAGVASTDMFIPQSSWNGDKLDGTGASGGTIDPQKYNVFQIGIQFLGAGTLNFQVEVSPNNSNNSEWVTVHTIKLPNTLTETSFGNPSFPFTMAVYSAGSSTNLTLKCGSFAGFIEGEKSFTGNRFGYNGSVVANTSSFNTELTIMNPRYYSGRSNQAVVNILSISFAQQHNNVSTVYLFKNATLVGSPNFTQYSNNSCTLIDVSATSCTIADNSQLIWSGQIGAAGQITFTFEDDITLQPGETLSLAAKSLGGSPTINISLNTREEQ